MRKPIRRCVKVKGPVICGIDDSNSAAGAIAVARELAQRYGLPLIYAHVLDGKGGGDAPKRRLHEVAARAPADVAIDNGHPADRLVAFARERRASFLVVGNHGPGSSLLGSISADVSRRASCPVVVVPPTAEVAKPQEMAAEPDVQGGIVRFDIGHAVRRVA